MANFELFSETQLYPAGTSGAIEWESEYGNNAWPIIGDVDAVFPSGIAVRDALLRGLRAGGTLRVIQDIEIELNVLDNSKLDSDKRYVTEKNYCGNFQPISNGSILVNHGGFLFTAKARQTIRNSFDISIVSSTHASEFLHFRQQLQGQLISCNWQEWQVGFVSVPIPNLGTVSVEATQLKEGQYGTPNLLLRAETEQKWASEAAPYPYEFIGAFPTDLLPPLEYWGKINFYIFDSCQLVSIRNSANIQCINVDFAPIPIADYLPPATCSREVGGDCNASWANFLGNSNVYDSLSECEQGSDSGVCTGPLTWTCPSNSSDTRTYYLPITT
jgi:hypothetical protein